MQFNTLNKYVHTHTCGTLLVPTEGPLALERPFCSVYIAYIESESHSSLSHEDGIKGVGVPRATSDTLIHTGMPNIPGRRSKSPIYVYMYLYI
jgi:hypothetical protein